MSADLSLSTPTDDPLAVPGASDGCHTHSVCIVNDEHEPTAFWRKHTNLTIIPCWKTEKSIQKQSAIKKINLTQ